MHSTLTHDAATQSLLDLGWEALGEDRFEDGASGAVVARTWLNSSWSAWRLETTAIVTGGPLKRVHNGWRSDLPEDLGDQRASENADAQPLHAWAEALTCAARGDALPVHIAEQTPAELAAELQAAGWLATVAEQGVRLTVQRPGLFRTIVIELSPERGTWLHVDLAPLAADGPQREAALRLLCEAHARLQLVSVVAQAERVHLTCDLSWAVPGTGWLAAGLEAAHCATLALAREFDALARDRELAENYLKKGA
jgi:hypothetical protein